MPGLFDRRYPNRRWLVRSRDEVLGDDRGTLVVDLETPAVHEPRPGALDDPALGERLEGARVDALDHLDADVVAPTMVDEGALRAGVTPELGEARGALAGPIGPGDPTGRPIRRDQIGDERPLPVLMSPWVVRQV
jgi:hypothetical protein